MKRIFCTFGLLLLILVTIILIRTLMFSSDGQEDVDLVSVDVDTARVTQNMSDAITFKTISTGDTATQNYQPFIDFTAWLKSRYPRVHQTLSLTKVANHTLLFKWQGSDASLKPILLTAHYDVVPVVPGSESDWNYPPFEGIVADGYVWGRGAMDDKSGVVVMLEATSKLINQGFVPQRTIYLSFGHDEEVGGRQGAKGVVELLKAQGVQLKWSIDEGSFIANGVFPGLDKPLAPINVAEKGSVSFDLIARGPGGHSSMPAAELPIDILATALVNLRKQPLPGGIEGVSEKMIDGIGRSGPFSIRMLAANKWLFGSVLDRELSKTRTGNALLRTTTAPTILRSGVKTNVIAPSATATVNFRLHPRDTPASVKAHILKAVGDPRVEVKTHGEGMSTLASKVSSTESDGYKIISKVARQIFGDIIVVPGITVGGTDSKHYNRVADDSYRFQYMLVTPEDIAGFHGTNERVLIDNLVKGTGAYYLLMKQAAGPK
jgi:carboxypeptidase PM20D1